MRRFAPAALAVLVLAAKVFAQGDPGNPAGITWIPIASGTFLMGSLDGEKNERPVHRVSVKAFQIAKSAVTVKQYKACVKAGACTPTHASDGTCYLYDGSKWNAQKLPDSYQDPDQPVVCVSWHQARVFSEWAGGRLPSEAEWEYAARSQGQDRKYPWGNEEPTCARAVMNEKNLPGCGRGSTWPVCSKPKGNTDQGVCDMAGNTWEWVQDWYHASYDSAPADGSAWETPEGAERVYRGGGAWYATANYLRAALRAPFNPRFRGFYYGFRSARSSP